MIADFFVKHIRTQRHDVFRTYCDKYDMAYWKLAWVTNNTCLKKSKFDKPYVQCFICVNGRECTNYDPVHLVQECHS